MLLEAMYASVVSPPRPQGPLVGGQSLSATDAALAPKLYHVEVALKHYKVRRALDNGTRNSFSF